jgi:hypothetical protein
MEQSGNLRNLTALPFFGHNWQEEDKCQNRKQVFVRQEHLTDMLKKAPATAITWTEDYF